MNKNMSEAIVLSKIALAEMSVSISKSEAPILTNAQKKALKTCFGADIRLDRELFLTEVKRQFSKPMQRSLVASFQSLTNLLNDNYDSYWDRFTSDMLDALEKIGFCFDEKHGILTTKEAKKDLYSIEFKQEVYANLSRHYGRYFRILFPCMYSFK